MVDGAGRRVDCDHAVTRPDAGRRVHAEHEVIDLHAVLPAVADVTGGVEG